VLQQYLLAVDLTEGQIGVHGAVTRVAAAAGMFALAGMADRVRRRVRAVVICQTTAAVAPAVLCGLSLLSPDIRTPALVLASIVALRLALEPISSLRAMLDGSLLVRTVRLGIRGRFVGRRMLAVGLAALGLSYLAARILDAAGSPRGFTLCFAIAVPLYLAGALSTARLVELPDLKAPRRKGSLSPWAAIRDIWALQEFRVLLGPYVLRGLAVGVLYFAWVVGAKRLDLPLSYAGYAATANAVAGYVFGSIAVGLMVDRWGTGPTVFVGCTLAAVALVGLVFTQSPPVFLAFYALQAFGAAVMRSCVPLGTLAVAPPHLTGAFNGARLMLLGALGAASTLLVGWLLESVDPRPVFVCGAALTFVMGIWHWHGFRSERHKAEP